MRRYLHNIALAFIGIVVLACSSAQGVEVAPMTGDTGNEASEAVSAADLPEGCELGERVEVDGAVIYAVVDDNAPSKPEYITLHEAMESELASVRDREALETHLES